MRYWVYINDKVDGPYEEEKLVTLDGFTPETLICSEDIEEGGSQEWVKASNIFEFDEAAKTMTRAPLTEEELNTIRGNSSDVTATSPITQVPAAQDTASTQILIEKIDNLTREIESLKTKLDAALAASAAPIAATHSQAAAISNQTSDPVTEEALITNTESLVNHAEKLVAQASSSQAKPVDFLDEIQIGSAKTESLSEKGGEEVVLRSALDSLYNAKTEPEEEKEATFQDLLSSAKVITEPPVSASPVQSAPAAEGAAPAAVSQEEPQKQEETSEFAPAPAPEPKEEPVEPQPVLEQPLPKEEEAEPVTEEKREEIINEITASAQQSDLILQAIEEAQKEEKPEIASLDNAAQETAEKTASAVSEEKEEPTEENQVPQLGDLPKEKESLDLTDQPQLSITGAEQTAKTLPPQTQAAQFQPQEDLSGALTPMDPNAVEESDKKEVTETIKELVPGKKIEPQEEEGLISQADLEEAFTERAPSPEFPIPEETSSANVPPASEQSAAVQQTESSLPEGKGFYNPNDMTEVELKEGSTYLISDFIPPATASGKDSAAIPQSYGAVPGSSEAAQANVESKPKVEVQPVTEAVEEIIPAKRDETDLSMSKVILENTIKTKRGATMDIKTVPMVQEPSEANRLDLSDSDLDINTQHDLKAADLKTGKNKLTKMLLGTLVSVVILALIYVMLAYLEILPAQFNFLKSAAAEQQIQVSEDQLNEMLGTDMDPALGQQPDTLAVGQNMNTQPGQPADGTAFPMQQGALPQDVTQATIQNGQMMPLQPAANPLDPILLEVQNFPMINGQTLQQVINARHPAAQNLIEWNITTAVEPDNYSILVKVPPENPQSFKISYRFNYNTVTKTLDPTISDSKNLMDSLQPQQPAR